MAVNRSRQCRRAVHRMTALLIAFLLIIPTLAYPRPTSAQDELPELWSYEGTEFFENNPVASNGIVLATTADSVVHAVDAESGEALWQTETGYINRPYMRVADRVLFTLTPDDMGLNALDITPEGAEERWSAELPGPLEALNTPVTEDGLILLLVDLGGSEAGQVMALSVEDGSEVWSADVSEFVYGVGLLYANGVAIVGIDERLTGLDAATGDELWQIDLDPTSVMLAAGEDIVFGAVRESDELFALDISTGDERWNATSPEAFNAPLAHGDGLVFFDVPLEVDGDRVRGILALDAETGEEQFTTAAMVGEINAGVANNGLLYVASDETVGQDGALEVYSSDDGTLLARAAVNAIGVGVDAETGGIFANTRGSDGDLLRAYQPVPGSGAGEEAGETNGAASGDWPLDLAAMALTPWDLADAGMENYGHGFSEMVGLEAFAAGIAGAREAPVEEVRDRLEEAGFLRAYYASFYSPADDEDVVQTISSYVIEFADEDGASAAWEYLEDESDLDDTEDIDGFDDYGDASEATLSSGEDSVTGDPFAQLDVSTQLGNLHTGLTIFDWNNVEPDEDRAAKLIEYAIEQVENGLNADQPALSNLIPRLSGDTVLGYYDAYVLRDGEAIWFYGEPPAVSDAVLDDADETGKISTYYLWKYIPLSDTDENANVWTEQRLIAFENEDAADAWLADHRESVEESESFTDLEFEEIDIADGGYELTTRLADDDFFARAIAYRSGSLVVMIELLGPAPPTEGALDAFVDAQQTCLDEEGCLEAVELSGDLAEYVADAEAAVNGEGGEDEEAGASTEEGVYVSEQWGYTVTWNPDRWDNEETSFPDGVMLVLDDESNTLITISGEEASDTDPVACVEDTVTVMDSMTADDISPTDDFAVPVTVNDAFGAVYAAGEDILFYQECRVLVEGEAVLQIGYRSDEEHWDQFLPDLEEMLASIEIETD